MSMGGGKGSSQQSSRSQGENWASSLGLGENFGVNASNTTGNSFDQSNSLSSGTSQSSSQSYVDPNQAPYINQLRQQAMNAYQSGQSTLNGFNQNLMSQGNAALGNLSALGNAQEVANAQLTGLQSGLDDIYQSGLSKLGGQAAMSNAFGGSRHALQEAALGGEVAKAYTQGYGDIIANANNQAITANNSAISGLGSLYNLGLGSQYGSLGALQGLLGDTTVLNSSNSSSVQNAISNAMGGSSNQSNSFGQNYGYNTNLSDAYGYNTSRSSGGSNNSNFNMGFK